MDIHIWLKGMIIGLSIAAPVGPLGVLCIRRTLSNGRLYGFVTGMGAATTDLIYAFIGGFGLTVISNFLISQQTTLRLMGGLFIIYLGTRIFFSKPKETRDTPKEQSLVGTFVSAFLVAITNPIAILYYIAVFAGLGVVVIDDNYFAAFLLVLGVFMGSTLWWIILSQGVGLIKNKITNRGLQLVNWFSGIVIVGFGVIAIWSGLFC